MAALRKVKQISQHEVAQLAGVSQPQISNIERGRATPTDEFLKTVGALLGVDPKDLLVPYDQFVQRQENRCVETDLR